MADKWGQFDNELSGGSDTWDNGLAGEILLADYFDVSTPIADSFYKGSIGFSNVYKGSRGLVNLYLGTKS